MLYVKQVTTLSGKTMWAIKDSTTNHTVKSINSPGMAYFDTELQAKRRLLTYSLIFANVISMQCVTIRDEHY